MQAYIIDVADDAIHAERGERSDRGSAVVADLVLAALRPDQDPTLYAIFFGTPPADARCEQVGDGVHLARPADPAQLRRWIFQAVSPYGGGGCQVRSSLTCRCAIFGYDGQALLCLRTEDPAPVSPDPSMVVIKQRPDLIVGNDTFDGHAPWTMRMAGQGPRPHPAGSTQAHDRSPSPPPASTRTRSPARQT